MGPPNLADRQTNHIMGPQAVKKHCIKKNITGLRNQKCPTATIDENNDLGLGLLFDSTRVDWPTGAKYRYREDKKNFATAKEIAQKYLDACPVDVIKKFINWTWRFMDAYRKGLTGKALLWAIWKFRQHWCISEGALKAFEEDSQHRAGQ